MSDGDDEHVRTATKNAIRVHAAIEAIVKPQSDGAAPVMEIGRRWSAIARKHGYQVDAFGLKIWGETLPIALEHLRREAERRRR